MKTIKIFLILFLASAMIGCQDKQENTLPIHVGGKLIEVLFGTEPETEQKAGEPIKIYVEVIQDGQPVEDADEVLFEIWIESKEEKDIHQENPHEHHKEGGEEKQQDHSHHGNQTHLDMEDYESEDEFIEGVHQGNGIYMVKKSFDEVGTYTIMYHVTARGYHAMKPHQIVIAK